LHWVGCCIVKSDFAAKPCGKLLKIRLDNLLLERGLAASPEKAQALILAGRVLVDEQRAAKAGAPTEQNASIRVLGDERKYVSRGGLKLEKALEHWRIDVRGKTCLDVGTSTGGFTDCLLQHGAARVIALDTGYGQIDYRLRQDPRVRLLENTNARYLAHNHIGVAIDFIAIDVSFISATSVLPAVIKAAFRDPAASRQIVILVKPQFEVDREQVEKGGIVSNPEAQSASVEKVRNSLLNLHCKETDVIESPILGAEGNREFLLYGLF
jgi:23S rRNA (cytidine1920-2'-O)/16S rRNA (cytidine1409-2'-O)-methyltransferase